MKFLRRFWCWFIGHDWRTWHDNAAWRCHRCGRVETALQRMQQ